MTKTSAGGSPASQAPATEFIEVGSGAAARRIAVLRRSGSQPTVVWLSGFRSDMRGIKADAVDAWAEASGHACLRLDYTAHGESDGRFEDCTISLWLEDVLTVLQRFAGERPIIIGSSMGGWLALLATARLLAAGSPQAPGGLVLIAPAVDFTERLWASMPQEGRGAIERDGVWYRPSAYSDEPYPFTRALIEDGRRHVMLDRPIATGCPVHILQGMQDPDVPWEHAMEVVEHLPGDCVNLTLIKDGDHRQSRPQDIERLVGAVAAIVAQAKDA